MKQIFKVKLGVEDNIKLVFEFSPAPGNVNDIIESWITQSQILNKQPTVLITIKPRSRPSSSTPVVGASILTIIEMELIKKAVYDATSEMKNEITNNGLKIDQLSLKIEELLTETREVNRINSELKPKEDELARNLSACKNIHPLLDLVSKFHLIIIKQLKLNDPEIPSNCNDWDSVYKYLKGTRKLRKILFLFLLIFCQFFTIIK